MKMEVLLNDVNYQALCAVAFCWLIGKGEYQPAAILALTFAQFGFRIMETNLKKHMDTKLGYSKK